MNLVFDENSTLIESVTSVVESIRVAGFITLRTSGTTGAPKEIIRNLSEALARKKAGSPTERWLLTYSPQRWAGISVILHAVKAGATLCVPKTLGFEDVIEVGFAHQITHLSLTPSMFRNLLINDPGQRLPKIPVEQLTFGGEAATQSVLDLGRSTWPKARVAHVYASTELGDVCSVSDGLEGIPARKFEQFVFDAEGELIINGQRTGDLWQLRGERYHFIGRIQEIINVGGNKVSPITIEEFAVRRGALFARAFAIPSPLMGSLVGLEYVGAMPQQELLKLFRSELPKYMCPARITKLDRIALSDAGKTRRLS